MVASLGAGGSERVMASLANHWADAGHQVAIITLGSEADDTYPLDPRVQRVALAMMTESRSLPNAVLLNLRRLIALRRSIRSLDPDVVISFNASLNVLALLACIGLRVRVAVSERTHPPSHRIGAAWALLRTLAYPLADAVIVQSEAVQRWAQGVTRLDRIHVIPNAVSSTFVAPQGERNHRLPVVLAVGRLGPEKGFDLLIRAFSSIARRYPHWSLTIVGDGREAAALKALAAELLAPGVVVFAGAVAEPERYYRSAALFVLSSRFEGFPNSLLEAMASGCAVVATDCPAGPSEIVRHGVDGVLVPAEDVASLAREMGRLMGDASERERLGARAREVATRFRHDRIMQLWDNIIRRVRE